MKPIYLDYNATTPLDPLVTEAMLPYLNEHYGNPSSTHYYGIEAKKAVENARKQVAEMLECQIDEVIFTSGGSESNNFAIKGVAYAYRKKGNHIITSQVEHPAVLEVCRYLEHQGFSITYLPVDEFCLINPTDLVNAIKPQTILISIMHANNEVGTIQPIEEIAEIAHERNVLLHSDCAQSIGKIPVNIHDLKVDLLSIAGHKIYAPKGVGALYIRTGVQLEKLIHGANHEMDKRAGTENVPEIVALGKACEIILKNLKENQIHLKKNRDRLEEGLKTKHLNFKINGHVEKRLPNTCSISFPGLEANTILAELIKVAASAGAACHSDQINVSHVLEAMKIPVNIAMGTIRFTVGRYTVAEEIDRAVDEIAKVIRRLQPVNDQPFLSSNLSGIKLTQYTHGLGCACKLRPQLLEKVIQKLPIPKDKNILIGTETADDAAVYRIDDKTAIIQTVDFFTPIVDEPFQFGAIAATNSLSDIYAMGGKPLFALNVVGFPSNRLSVKVLEEILNGANKKAKEAGINIIGGHTVDDTEPKFGLAVTGIIHPAKILTNQNAKPGDILILTKPIGTGILSTALKQGILDVKTKKILIKTMLELNKKPAEIMQKIGVNSCTDITGFGLLGHLLEMMNGSKTSAEIYMENIPILPEVNSLVTMNVIPGGTKSNYEYTMGFVSYSDKISKNKKLILNDAQTSGGLLISVPKNKSQKLFNLLITNGVKKAKIIGEVVENSKIKIYIK